MNDVTIWYDPASFRHYIKKGNVVERIHPLMRQYIEDLISENDRLLEETKRLRTVAFRYYTELLNSDDVLGQIMARKKLQELGIEVE